MKKLVLLLVGLSLLFVECAMIASKLPGKTLSSIGIEGIINVSVGGSTNLKAKGTDADGNPISVNPVWTTESPSIGDMGEVTITPSVGANVTVKGVKKGYVNIVAEDRGVRKVKEAFEIR